MRQATYTNGQFVDQVALNTLSADANSSIQQIANRWDLPGLIHPEAIGWATSGLVVTATCPAPFAVQFASGVVAQALGTTNGATGSTYNINLSSFVPGAGSATVYILASYNQLSLTPETIVGPPQGNPAYNPTFTQFQWYSETVDSIAIAGSSGAANNTSTFELARLTLTAGQSSISLSALNYANQIPSSEIQTSQAISVTGSTTLTRSGAGLVYEFTTSGVTATLPLAAQSNGYEYYFFGRITSGYATVAGNGTDLISGLGGPGASGTSISILPNMAFGVRSNGIFWETFIEAAAAPIVWNANGTPPSPLSISASGGVQTPYSITASGATNSNQLMTLAQASGRLLNVQTFTSSSIYTPTSGTQSVIVEVQGGGGGGGGCPSTSSSQQAQAGGGQCGAYGMGRYTSGFSGVIVTVGAAGSGGATGSNPGNSGGTSSFGSLLTAPGGSGGTAGIASPTTTQAAPPTAGSAPTGANLISKISVSGPGFVVLGLGAGQVLGGGGGSSPLGDGGPPATGTGGNAGTGFGAGGGGCSQYASEAGSPGGNGTAGVVIVWEYA